jgi:5'-3' exonuclease
MCKHLLIDAKNMLYRAVYVAAYGKQFQKSGHHTINIVLHFLSDYLNKIKPEQIHIFWDSPRSDTWRKQIYPEYKEGRSGGGKVTADEVSESVNELIEICTQMFKNMGFRQYYCAEQEADDLIYAFCKLNSRDPIVIISSDKDLLQISYHYPYVKIHSHLSKSTGYFELVPTSDPVIQKCLTGDKSDNIDGYYRVGPVTANVLTESAKARNEFFESDRALAKVEGHIQVVGYKKFKENLLLVDLSLNPYLLDNVMYISERQFQEIRFDLDKIRQLISKYKLRGVTADMSRYVGPFKKLVEVSNG